MITMELRLRVEYSPNGVSIEELKSYLEQVALDVLNRGGLTGESEAEVSHYSVEIIIGKKEVM